MEKNYWVKKFAEVYDHIMHDCIEEEGKWPCRHQKGYIITDDETGEYFDFIKTCLNYDALKTAGKVSELTIDESWTHCMQKTLDNDNALEFWNKIVKGAYQAKAGVLVLNISNIMAFGLCWHLKQLAKQEKELIAWRPNSFEPFDETSGFFDLDDLKGKANKLLYKGDSKESVEEYVDSRIKNARSQKLIPSEYKFKGYVIINLVNLKWDDVRKYAKENNRGEYDAMMDFYRLITI